MGDKSLTLEYKKRYHVQVLFISNKDTFADE